LFEDLALKKTGAGPVSSKSSPGNKRVAEKAWRTMTTALDLRNDAREHHRSH
jgi:hypothetical protein